MNFYYQDISFTEINQTAAISFEMLIANIGGVLGLCIGASLLTLAEFCELIWILFLAIGNLGPWLSLKNKKNKQKIEIERQNTELRFDIF